MKGHLRIGSVLGIPIALHYSWVVIAVLINKRLTRLGSCRHVHVFSLTIRVPKTSELRLGHEPLAAGSSER
jgi:hypothetical protein